MSHIIVIHAGGDRFRIYARGHELQVDQPVEVGGLDLAPTPTELFVASLASCIAFYGRRFLRRHELPEHIEVGAGFVMGDKPARVEQITLRVEALGVPAELRERFEKVISHCTVHNTLFEPPEVTITTETAPPEVALVS